MRRQPLFGLRTAVTLVLFAIAGFPLILSVDAGQLYVSADGAIRLDPDYSNLLYSVDASTQCKTIGTYYAGTTSTTKGTISLSELGPGGRSDACTGTNAAVSFPASCTMTSTTLTCGSKTFTSSVDSSWQLSSGTVYKGCTSTGGGVRVNNSYMTLDFFANGCVLQQMPYVARGGLVWIMGIPVMDAACMATLTDPPSTPSPLGPPPTPAPPTPTGALFSATATQLCLKDSSNVCLYTDCSAAAGGGGSGATPTATTATPPGATATAPAATETPSSPSSSSTTVGIAVAVAVVAVVGVAAGVVLIRRRGRSAAHVTTSATPSAVLIPQTAPYSPLYQQQPPRPAVQKGADDDCLL